MSRSHRNVSALLAATFLGLMFVAVAPAEQLSQEQISKALRISPTTRSLTPSAQPAASNSLAISPDDQNFVENLRQHNSRSLTPTDRKRVASLIKATVDLEVFFDYNSAKITDKSIPQLTSLGNTLAEPEHKDSVFLIGGHTDAKGSDGSNQILSQRRAEMVKKYLVEKFHITPSNLVTAGYGKQDLKNTAEPFAAENRRVQIGNLGATARAQ
jgi:outer membrane protein OmpA-like peptidoglycan-associated protein